MAINEDAGALVLWNYLLEAVGTTQLSGDLMIQIALRLPVKSILRFKSVCNAWCALFNNPIFIQHHSRTASSSSDINYMGSFLVRPQCADEEEEKDVCLFSSVLVPTRGGRYITVGHHGKFPILSASRDGWPTSINLHTPFEGDWKNIKVVGSTNGLVCLNLNQNGTTIVLWNPATKKYSQIPTPKLVLADYDHVCLGFAYDAETDCYKVIRTMNSSADLRFKAEVYSSRTKSWRTIEVVADFPSLIILTSCGNVVRGNPYWFTYEFKEDRPICGKVLLWFDASMDAFRFRRLPLGDPPGNPWIVKTGLGVKGDDPIAYAFSCTLDFEEYETYIDIWKLNKCDDEGEDRSILGKSWCEYFTHVGALIGFLGDGRIIALDYQEQGLFIFDPHSSNKDERYLGIKSRVPPSANDGTEVYDYFENLVSPSSLV